MNKETKIKIVDNFNRMRGLFLHYKNYRSNGERNIYVIGTPEYSNMGDHAIAISQMELLHRLFPNDKIIEVTNDTFKVDLLAIKAAIRKNDIITLIGGGNFGDEYLVEQNIRMTCIKNFRNNKIIIFPQTIYYSNTEHGKKCLINDKKIIEKHKNLNIIAREEKSYEFAKKNFSNSGVFFLPDTVLYLRRSFNNERNKILICFRNDKESVNGKDNIRKNIIKILSDTRIDTENIDTVVQYNVLPKNRNKELDTLLDTISGAKLVITDRLHGMIFCAITNTPCIVFPNYNHKVEGCYKTIQKLKYIKFFPKWNEEVFRNTVFELLQGVDCNFLDIEYDIKNYEQQLKNIINNN